MNTVTESKNIDYDSLKETYCLLTAYLREEGRVMVGTYDDVLIENFVHFLAQLMNRPDLLDEQTNVVVGENENV